MAQAPDAPQSAADSERDARSLNALARLYAKLVELDDAATSSSAVAPAGHALALADFPRPFTRR